MEEEPVKKLLLPPWLLFKNEEQIKEIIENKDNLSYAELGRIYNRSGSSISDIVNGRTFKDLYRKYKK